MEGPMHAGMGRGISFGALGLAALGSLALGLVAQGCIEHGSGVSAERTVEIDTAGVDQLSVCCGFQVHGEQGTDDPGEGGAGPGGAGPADSTEVRISADDNLIDHVLVQVIDRTLVLGWRDDGVVHDPGVPVTIELTLPELTRLDASGGSHVEFGPLESTDLAVSSSGGGFVRFESLLAESVLVDASGGGRLELPDLEAADLVLSSSGGGVTELGGTCPELTLDVSGGGQVLAFELETETTHMSLSGGGIAELNVTESLTGGASGGSQVSVRGGGEVSLDLSGGSTVSTE